MAKDGRVFSSDEHPVPHEHDENAECGTGVEKLSTTKRIMRKADENKVLITLWIAIAIFIGREVWTARDSSLTHGVRISAIEDDIKEIKKDVKTLIREVR